MARLKGKDEEIKGKLDQKYWVQKSDPLVLMRSVPFSLGELKVLDTYISRINAADDSRTTVIFTKKEYEELMGISKINAEVLKKHAEGLLGKIVTLEMPDKSFLKFVLFTSAYYHLDDCGVPIIELSCSLQAKDLFFCIGKYHYFKYALENVINLTRKASYLLYIHILYNRYRSEWELSLDELRDSVLDCKEQESYQEYKIFKNRVLDPAVKEINKKTDCHFTYESIKRGRKVAKIKFIYHSEKQIADKLKIIEELDNNQITLEEVNQEKDLWQSPLEDFNFSEEQFAEIFSVLVTIPEFKLPQSSACYGSIELMRYHYIDQKAKEIIRRDKQKPIRSKFSYLLKLLKQDAEIAKE